MATNFIKIDLDSENSTNPKMAKKMTIPKCARCSKKCDPECYILTQEMSSFSYGQTSDSEVTCRTFTCSAACHKAIYMVEADKVMDEQIARWGSLYVGLKDLVTGMLREKEPMAMDFLHSIKAIKLFVEYMEDVTSKQKSMAYLLQKRADVKSAISIPLENLHEERTMLNMLCKMNKLIDSIVKLEVYV